MSKPRRETLTYNEHLAKVPFQGFDRDKEGLNAKCCCKVMYNNALVLLIVAGNILL